MPRSIPKKYFFLALALIILAGFLGSKELSLKLLGRYAEWEPVMISDRFGKEISLLPNARGYYGRYLKEVPDRFAELLVQKEDRYFYAHPGVNPTSILRAGFHFLRRREFTGASTISQQLVKLLLEREGNRTWNNKIVETLYTLALELHESKEKILTMYTNTAYFGNRRQGLAEASLFYFGRPSEVLTDKEVLELLATLESPSERYPGTPANKEGLLQLAARLDVDIGEAAPPHENTPSRTDSRNYPTTFELDAFKSSCEHSCRLTIDKDLTEQLREILRRNLLSPAFAGAMNGAIVVLKMPENELLALVGSPDPRAQVRAYQINMALAPRPIGSTAKPFIYLEGFEKGLRPYTLVDDREYKYLIGTGFPLYPKNYDYTYHGIVALHYALANSLNVPTVKVLEYVGVDEFKRFLAEQLGFKPLQPLENHELGIALGGLEMDLLTLAHYFTVFPNGGVLKPMTVFLDYPDVIPQFSPPMAQPQNEKRVAEPQYVDLVNAILTDRQTGVEQFGIRSSLNLPWRHYAVKTGTSREFHDSWTIGYTPDFLVGVWVGNADNTPLEGLSGQNGAGEIWHEAMELLLNSPYHKKTPFTFKAVREFSEDGKIEYGLPRDDYERARTLLLENDGGLILEPHPGDTFLLKDAHIHLEARRPVEWRVDGSPIAFGKEAFFIPEKAGKYGVEAHGPDGVAEQVIIVVQREDE